MLRPSKWHPKVGEEFWSADVEVASGVAFAKATKHTFALNNGEALILVGFDNCYKSEKQAYNQADYLLSQLGL